MLNSLKKNLTQQTTMEDRGSRQLHYIQAHLDHDPDEDQTDALQPLLDKYGVDLVMWGTTIIMKG